MLYAEIPQELGPPLTMGAVFGTPSHRHADKPEGVNERAARYITKEH